MNTHLGHGSSKRPGETRLTSGSMTKRFVPDVMKVAWGHVGLHGGSVG